MWEALVMMLKNTATNTYHPILYYEKPLPGGPESEGNQKLVRYKSKGHRTVGFTNREDAVKSIDTELSVEKLKGLGYNRNVELDGDLEWDGSGIPADVQTRFKELQK